MFYSINILFAFLALTRTNIYLIAIKHVIVKLLIVLEVDNLANIAKI